ncbi:pyridoxamine 5'-phosphate oxidase [Nocardioides cavernaquae]|uniref:Pyridoxine/pyridoxamine 5'-phosphate oxidase n=1 Tax=Nocardioides cavernaquae TaxID=2321396 RepID=A0A3A5H6R4_9ACTN|nr:pyridoxamine 5'-phosphate oxidase [Nocardioides cavernaquae]RJS46366.1 pyridoxamine 5'-phosphate oxidase [Nocardioides cavernaquae]
MNEHLASLRAEYAAAGLHESGMPADPIEMFRRWFADAGELDEPNAMILATVSAEGQPSSRIVLLKGLDARGFAFYTNQRSRKGLELAANPRCALLFPWHGLQRQVRVEGVAVPLADAEVAAYFAKRPRGAQLGAMASPQSQVVSREELDARFVAADAAYPDEVPVPDGWGGYVVEPTLVEFWQGGVNRLHDRVRYRLAGAGEGEEWALERLAP